MKPKIRQPKFWLITLASLIAGVGVPDARTQVVLSEIMFDASGNESHDEFIEIVNLSASEEINLSGWQISDGSSTDNLRQVDDGLTLLPGQFGIILDLSYLENSSLYDPLIPPGSLILTIDNNTFGSRGLSNSTAETVTLLNGEGQIVSEYTYSLGNTPGFSDEKIDLSGPNFEDNWADSKILLGSPGAQNSVSPLTFDLSVRSQDIRFDPEPALTGEPVDISLSVHNVGIEPATGFEVQVYLDVDGDSALAPGELLGDPFIFDEEVTAGDSIVFSLTFLDVGPGLITIAALVSYGPDQDLTNNQAFKELVVGARVNDVRVNEIMYSPFAGQSEWIELTNRSRSDVNLRGWSVSDNDVADRAVISTGFILLSGQFAVLAKDSSIAQTPDFPQSSLIVLKDFPSLNNDSDAVVLQDPAGATIDRVDYANDWGGATGVSLEKINPDLASNDAANWSSSVALAGSSPGSQNSIFITSLPERTRLAIEPNPFSPDGDGDNDFALINYSLPVTTAAVNIKIFDLRGRLIRFLSNNQASGAENTVVWDGLNDAGDLARMGIYIVFLQALNSGAGVLVAEKKTLVLAGKL